jgi:4-amino-4-deoxy-L-arabinose transferase-like glycosyltransferase
MNLYHDVLDDSIGGRRAAVVSIVLLAAVCLLLFGTGIATLPLTDPDESRCCQIVQNMIRTHNYVIPHLDGDVYYDKPAPFFWLACAVQLSGGSMELGGRAVAAFAGFCAVLVTFFWARRLAGTAAGLLAGIMLATGAEFFFIARWYRMDMPFAAAMWAALLWFWRYENEAETKSRHLKQWLGFYFFAAIATLMKGPAGLLLPALVIGAYMLLAGKRRNLRGFFCIPALIVFFAVAAPCYIAACMREHDYAYQFFVKQNFSRFATRSMAPQTWPGIVYVGIIIAGMFPWTFLLPATIERFFPRKWQERTKNPAVLFLWLSVLVPLLFFGFAKSKMGNYILPVFAPLAVLTALPVISWAKSQAPDRAVRDAMRVMAGFCVVLPFAFDAALIYLGGLNIISATGSVLIFISALRAVRYLKNPERMQTVVCTCASIILFFVTLSAGVFPGLYELISYRQLSRTIEKSIKPADTICFFGNPRRSFAIYAGHPEAVKFSTKDADAAQKIEKLLTSANDTWFLVTGQKATDYLRQTAKKPLTVRAHRGQYYVVTTAKLADNNTVEFESLPFGKEK